VFTFLTIKGNIDGVNIKAPVRKSQRTVRHKRSTYHHGDARNALLASAKTLLERVGVSELSLRRVAEMAGLSRQAPYNHFSDKEALLAELVRAGFQRLESDVRGVDAFPAGPEALERAADAYIGFALSAPTLFRLMFSRELVDRERFPEVGEAGAAAQQALSDIVAAFCDPPRREELSLAAWSLVHGYATLCLEMCLEDESQREQRAHIFAQLIRRGAES
jgi:AcrR family transcriptional regulator